MQQSRTPSELLLFAKQLKDLERYGEARAVLEELISAQPNNPKAHFRLATLLGSGTMTEESAEAYRRCLELAPEHPGALLGLGHTLKTLGRQEESISAYLRCIEVHPKNGEVYYSLANLKTYRFSDAQIIAMKRRLTGGDVQAVEEVNLLFALARAYEQRGDYSTAWRYYESGNSRQRRLINYDWQQTKTINDSLVAFYNHAFFEKTAAYGNPDPAPIFILGMPRSGSTLVEQIIASHSQVEGTGELPYIARLISSLGRNHAGDSKHPAVLSELEANQFAALGRRYLQMADRHRPEAGPCFIDKMPNNFSRIGFIHAILPNAKIIDVRRNPMDACVGNLRQLYAKGQPFCYDQRDVGEYYLQYQRMMDHWDEVLPGQVLHVQYENIVENLELQARRILAHLELPWEDDCLNYHQTNRAVRSASSSQVRQAIYSSGIGFWKNYQPKLKELQRVLQPIIYRDQ